MSQEEMEKKMGQIVAKAWSDSAFKNKLLKEAVATLKGEGVDVPEGLEVRVVENTEKVRYILLPAKPINYEEFDEKTFSEIAAGVPVRGVRLPSKSGMIELCWRVVLNPDKDPCMGGARVF